MPSAASRQPERKLPIPLGAIARQRPMTMRILSIGNYLNDPVDTPQPMEALAPKLSECGFRVRLVSAFSFRPLRLAHMVSAVLSARSRYNIVLIDTFSGPAFAFAYLCGKAARIVRIPYVAVLHGGRLPEWAEKHPGAVREYLRGAAAVTAVSHYLSESLSRLRSDIRVIPNMLPLDRYRQRVRGPWRPRYLWLRRFHSMYNPKMAVRSFAQILARRPGATMTMAGPDAGQAAATMALARMLNVARSIHFPGKLTKDQIYRLAEDHDFFLHTSRVDNQPVTVLEAMALGLPVVGVDSGGMRYMVEDGVSGMLVPEGDYRAMADACELLLREPRRADSLGRAGRRVAERSSWQNVRGRWFELFDEVCRHGAECCGNRDRPEGRRPGTGVP